MFQASRFGCSLGENSCNVRVGTKVTAAVYPASDEHLICSSQSSYVPPRKGSSSVLVYLQ